MDEINPHQKIKEAQEKLELYLITDNFFKLFNETKKYVSNSDFLDGKELSDGITSDDVINVISLNIIEEIVSRPKKC